MALQANYDLVKPYLPKLMDRTYSVATVASMVNMNKITVSRIVRAERNKLQFTWLERFADDFKAKRINEKLSQADAGELLGWEIYDANGTRYCDKTCQLEACTYVPTEADKKKIKEVFAIEPRYDAVKEEYTPKAVKEAFESICKPEEQKPVTLNYIKEESVINSPKAEPKRITCEDVKRIIIEHSNQYALQHLGEDLSEHLDIVKWLLKGLTDIGYIFEVAENE